MLPGVFAYCATVYGLPRLVGPSSRSDSGFSRCQAIEYLAHQQPGLVWCEIQVELGFGVAADDIQNPFQGIDVFLVCLA